MRLGNLSEMFCQTFIHLLFPKVRFMVTSWVKKAWQILTDHSPTCSRDHCSLKVHRHSTSRTTLEREKEKLRGVFLYLYVLLISKHSESESKLSAKKAQKCSYTTKWEENKTLGGMKRASERNLVSNWLTSFFSFYL